MENMMDIAQYNLIHVTDYIYIYILHILLKPIETQTPVLVHPIDIGTFNAT